MSKAQVLGVLLVVTVVAIFAFGAGVSISPKEKVPNNFSVQAMIEALKQWQHDEWLTSIQLGDYNEEFQIQTIKMYAASGVQRLSCRQENDGVVCKQIPELTPTPVG